MKNTQWYLAAKKIHRLLVVLMLIIGLFMMGTGYFLHEGNYFFFDPQTIRYLHNQVSIFFSIILGIMTCTGLYLFLFPYFPVKKAEK